MKQVTTKEICAGCEDEYEYTSFEPSWGVSCLNAIILFLQPGSVFRYTCPRCFCSKCLEYERLLRRKEHFKEIKEYKNKRDKFLKENKYD